VTKTTVGAYGRWLGRIAIAKPGSLSFRNPRWRSLPAWRRTALARTLECFAPPASGGRPKVRLTRAYDWDGLHVEHLSWQLPFGPRTEAIFLKPAGARGRLPAVLALHSHGGNKWLGWRKIARGREAPPPIVREHVAQYDGGAFWANELAKRGYAVLAHDVFPFASRRVRIADVLDRVRGGASVRESRTVAGIWRYNDWAASHETTIARALFDAGTTWPGVTLAEDQRALDVLAARPDVDARRMGCAGLSGGGMRTCWLGGLDERIACAVCVGFMTTWRDFSVNKCWTHSWMSHVPILPREMDFPEILGLRVPRPTLVLSTRQDQLYTLPEMKRSDAILRAIWAKAKAPGAYRTSFYPGLHKFDGPMQKEAFQWFDRWLRH